MKWLFPKSHEVTPSAAARPVCVRVLNAEKWQVWRLCHLGVNSFLTHLLAPLKLRT